MGVHKVITTYFPSILNVSVPQVVLDLLQIPFDAKEDVRMNELMRLAHQFLQNFCLGNQNNQVLLHKHLELFLNHGQLEARTVCAIFQDNAVLCNEVNDKVVQHFVQCIETHGKHVQVRHSIANHMWR